MALVPLSDLAPRLLAYTNSSVGKTAFLRKPLLRVDVQPLLRLLRKPTKLKLVDFLNPPAMASRSFGKRKPRDGGAGKSFRTAKQLDALLCAFAHICTEIQEHTMSSTKKSDRCRPMSRTAKDGGRRPASQTLSRHSFRSPTPRRNGLEVQTIPTWSTEIG